MVEFSEYSQKNYTVDYFFCEKTRSGATCGSTRHSCTGDTEASGSLEFKASPAYVMRLSQKRSQGPASYVCCAWEVETGDS